MIEFLDPELAAGLRRRQTRRIRRRLVIEGRHFTNGTFTDGLVTLAIRGRRPATAGAPDTFDWRSNRPIAAVTVRSGFDGLETTTSVGPATSGVATGPAVSDGIPIAAAVFVYHVSREELAQRRRRHFGTGVRAAAAASSISSRQRTVAASVIRHPSLGVVPRVA